MTVTNRRTETLKEFYTRTAANSRAATAPVKSQSYVYAGPALPTGELKNNAILKGTLDSIKEAYSDVIEKYPHIGHLVVPVSKLAETREKLKRTDNILGKYYAELTIAVTKGLTVVSGGDSTKEV
ncbi:hypothetical protein FACS189425_06220 [Clostridia bacterium]|nr:hypothetical protein FACS189425_06220 [Clostridia bacterium]